MRMITLIVLICFASFVSAEIISGEFASAVASVDLTHYEIRTEFDSLAENVRPIKQEDGNYGLKISVTVELRTADRVVLYIDDITLTYAELDATATALGLDWDTVRGDNQQTVIMAAAINKASNMLGLSGDGAATFKAEMAVVFGSM